MLNFNGDHPWVMSPYIVSNAGAHSNILTRHQHDMLHFYSPNLIVVM